MNAPFRLPRRTRRVGAHAKGTTPAPEPQAGQAPAVRPLTAPAFTGETLTFPSVAGEEAAMAEARAELQAKITTIAPADTSMLLQRVADGLRNLPARPGAYLRNIMPDTGTGPSEPLNGFPSFAGASRMPDGSPVVGLFLGEGDELGQPVLDIPDVVFLGRLIDAAERARDELFEMHQADRDAVADGSEAA